MAEGPEEEEFACVVEEQGQEGKNGAQVSNDIQAPITDRVINHGLSFRKNGPLVQPILSRSTVAFVVRLF